MKHYVTLTVEVDPSEYSDAEDSEQGAIDLVQAMIDGQADWPGPKCFAFRCGDLRVRSS
jgi:hypothetical protein